MEIPEQRVLIHSEETKFDAATSEATFTRIGANQNFISKRQYDSKIWTANGKYSQAIGVTVGLDGNFPVLFKMEIIGLHIYNNVAGSSGRTRFDLFRQSVSGGSRTSLFSVSPAILFSAGDYGFSIFGYDPVVSYGAISPNIIVPVFAPNGRILNAGEQISCDMTETQIGGKNAGIELMVRPIS